VTKSAGEFLPIAPVFELARFRLMHRLYQAVTGNAAFLKSCGRGGLLDTGIRCGRIDGLTLLSRYAGGLRLITPGL
jgi:hypothetical protein